MKKLLFTFIALTTLALQGQSRTNRTNATMISETETLTQITGWHQEADTGNWIEGSNYINYSKYKSDWQSSNIQDIKFEKVSNAGKEYYALVYNFKSGYYTYKSIKKGWNNVRKMGIFLFSLEDYVSFKNNIDSKSNEIHALKTKMHFDIWSHEMKKEGIKYGKVTESLSKENKYGSDGGIVYQYQDVDGQEVVRFRVTSYIIDSKYSPLKLDNSYFEVSLEDFAKLLNL